MTKELMESNYMDALLRAALLLGDLHHTAPVCEITISGFVIHDKVRELHPRCKIVAQNDPGAHPISVPIPLQQAENYLILYPN